MKPKAFLTVVLAFLGITNAFAQATQTNYFLPAFYPKAPNTASLEKFGSYEVNLFTGLPNISIPIYTIDAGDIRIPITLSYHASGIRVSEVASWVGLGWSLSTGGTVNRKIIGKADDGVEGYMTGNLRLASSFNISNPSNSEIDSLMNYVLHWDARPDIFSYDIPGHSGKFFLDGTNAFVPRLIPFAPVKVSYTNTGTGNTAGINKFTILDEKGDVYVFGDNFIEPSYSGSQSQVATPANTGWPLESVVSENRHDTVSYTYTQQTVYQPDAVSNNDVVDDNINDNSSAHPYTYGYKQGSQNISTSFSVEELPQHIFFKNGRIDFDLQTSARTDINNGSGAYALKDVKIYRYNFAIKAMELQKTVVFFTSNFGQSSNNNLRLRLDSLQVLDKAGAIMQRYRFDYNTAVTLPFYGSLSKDYWGYYNGKANTSLTPNTVLQTVENGYSNNLTIGSTIPNSRFSDSTYMQAGVLTGVHYPTGGYSTFTYQTNQYLDGSQTLQQAGGLRIKSITSYDGINPTPIVKTYQYDLSTARKNFILDNCFFSTIQTHQFWEYEGNFGILIAATEREQSFVSNPRIDLEPFDAASVVYPNVTEYTGTPTVNIGKSTYIFRDLSDTEDISSMTGTPVVNSYFYARGQLLNKSDYLRKSDGTYQIVKSISNTYTSFPEIRYANVGLIVGKNVVNDGFFQTVYNGYSSMNPIQANGFIIANYSIRSDDNYLTGTMTTDYDLNDATKYTQSAVSYKRDNIAHQQVTRTVHTDSKGNTVIKTVKYPQDYLIGATTGSTVLDSMINRNMIAAPVEMFDTLKNTFNSSNAITSAQLNQYRYGSIPYTVLPDKISTLSVLAPVTNFVPASWASNTLTKDSRYVQMISFDGYEQFNNLSQYTARNSVPVSVLWDWNGERPVAQIKNATLSGASSQVAYTSFEADAKNDWYYTGTPVSDPTTPSGSLVYPLSSGSVTTNNNVMDFSIASTLSLWSNGAAPTVTAGTLITATAVRTSGNWTCYEYSIPTNSSGVTISGTMSIDELRLYPRGSLMTNYIYDTNGLIAMDDPKGAINHFEYDFSQRLKSVKDINGNIVNNYVYHTYDQTIGNDLQSGTFTRNNCPPNTVPQSTTYSVPANKYYSITKASANADANYDYNLNGQLKANTVCGCPVQIMNYTLSNSTGIGTFQVKFTGPATYNFTFPATGSTVVQVIAGTYTVQIFPTGTFANHTFTLGSRAPVVAPGYTFTSVQINSTQNETPLTIQ